jgi:Ca2+:H+ antiporter
LLDIATDQLSRKLGQTLGALLNASFGNAVELIVTIMALREGLTTVVQSSLLGSVLSNLLLVLGACFYLGGLKYSSQTFNLKAANVNASLLGVTMIAFMLPAAIRTKNTDGDELKILHFSRGISVLLLIIYIAFMLFQLRTHSHFFAAEDDSEEEETTVNVPVAIGALVTATILIGISAEFLVGSIEGISKSWDISETFIGLILIPIVGNAAEHVSAVGAAIRNKVILAILIVDGFGNWCSIRFFSSNCSLCHPICSMYRLDNERSSYSGISHV